MNEIEKEEMKNIKYWIAKKTAKIRYKLASFIIKRLTPVLYKKIDLKTFTNKVLGFNTDNIFSATRPSVEFMKEKFHGKLVKGAELGVARAANSKSILRELNIEKLYLIDAWDNYKGIDGIWTNIDENHKYVLSIFETDKRIEIIKNFSNIAVENIEDNSLDFVYVDANHKYKYAYEDIKLWYPKVKEGGIIGGHDVCQIDVLRAVKDFCFNKNIKFQTEIPDWYFVKSK